MRDIDNMKISRARYTAPPHETRYVELIHYRVVNSVFYFLHNTATEGLYVPYGLDTCFRRSMIPLLRSCPIMFVAPAYQRLHCPFALTHLWHFFEQCLLIPAIGVWEV